MRMTRRRSLLTLAEWSSLAAGVSASCFGSCAQGQTTTLNDSIPSTDWAYDALSALAQLGVVPPSDDRPGKRVYTAREFACILAGVAAEIELAAGVGIPALLTEARSWSGKDPLLKLCTRFQSEIDATA